MDMAAILFNGRWPFEQNFNPLLTEGCIWNLKKIGPGVSKKKSFKRAYGRTDGRRTSVDRNSSPLGFGSGEVKKSIENFRSCSFDHLGILNLSAEYL